MELKQNFSIKNTEEFEKISRKEYKSFVTHWIHDMEVKIFLYVGQLMSSNTAEGMEWQYEGVLGRHITD